jgi:hypothetical protein
MTERWRIRYGGNVARMGKKGKSILSSGEKERRKEVIWKTNA